MSYSSPPVANGHRLTPGARRALFAATVGTLIEWYDYALYGAAAALVITPLFFPTTLESAGDMAAFATFAVGFIFRPLGGIIISHIGDRVGRKPAMILTIVLMGAATVGIGLLPTAASIGVWAAVLLVLLRILQGFGAGAELAGAMTVVAEYVPVKRRGLFTGIVLATPPAGTMLATLSFLAVSGLDRSVLLGWAWRIPFLVSAVLFFLALFIRQRLEETPEYVDAAARQYENRKEHAIPIRELFTKSTKNVLIALLSVTGHNANNYILATFSLSFLTRTVGLPQSQALTAVLIAAVFGIIGSPIGGWLADRFAPGRIMAFSSILGILYAFPLFLAMRSGNIVVAAIALAFGYLVVLGTSSGAQGAFLTNLFPIRYRYSGVAVAREINGALVAGNTPLIAAALISAAHGGIHLAALYLMGTFVVSLLAVLMARGSADQPHPEPGDEYAAAHETGARG